jgi:hypothetical protein
MFRPHPIASDAGMFAFSLALQAKREEFSAESLQT